MRASIAGGFKSASHRPLRAKLIFNAGSGRPEESPQQLATILSEMQDHDILPEVYTVRPDSQVETIVRDAIKSGIKLIVVAGGDGTIDGVVGAMVGRDATLGIIPTGTRNNVAFNLGIGEDIPNSVALLRQGRHLKIDVGRVHFGRFRHWFLELATLGLLSDLYPMADDLQHGGLGQIGALLSTLASATPSRLRVSLDGHKVLGTTAHMILVTNMAFLGPHFQISPNVSFRDGRLDVFAFPDMSKLGMLSHAVLSRGALVKDAGVVHYHAKHIAISANPKMTVLADGIQLGQGSLIVHVHPRALRVVAGAELTGTRQPRRPIPSWCPMNEGAPKPVRVLPLTARASFWSAQQRRPVFLLLLVTGLVLVLAWLPGGTRASLWAALSAQRGLIVLLSLFALVTLSLIWSAGQRLDTRIFMLLNMQVYPRWLDRCMWLATQLGSMLAAMIAALLLYLLDHRRLAVEIVFGTLTLWLLVELIKAISDRDRPFHTLDKARVIGWRERGDSFPSGHTTQVFFLTALLIYHFQFGMVVAGALYAVAALVGLTRIYVGAHYPRDVIAGVVLGSVWGLLAILVDRYWLVLHF